MDIERVISTYENDSFIEEYDVSNIPFEELKKLFVLKQNDPQMYDPYEISVDIGLNMSSLIPDIKFHFEKYEYFLECFQR